MRTGLTANRRLARRRHTCSWGNTSSGNTPLSRSSDEEFVLAARKLVAFARLLHDWCKRSMKRRRRTRSFSVGKDYFFCFEFRTNTLDRKPNLCLAILQADHELQARPHFAYCTDLHIDEAGIQSDSAHDVLIEIRHHARRLLRPRDPEHR